MKPILLFAFLFAFSAKLFSQVKYPCGVYYKELNGTSDYGYWNNVYPTNDYTLAAWVQITDSVWQGKEMDIFQRQVGGLGDMDGLDLYLATNGQFKYRAYTFKNGVPTLDSLSSGVKPEPFKWYHVAVTFQSTGDCNFYINGNLAASKSFGGGMSLNYPYLNYLAIGEKVIYTPDYTKVTFKGYLDELVVAEKAFSQAQIDSLANGIATGSSFLKNNLVDSYDKEDTYPYGSYNSGIGGGSVAIVGTLHGCPVENKPPVANAGADQTITLPANSVTLDGSASYDPDGSIVSGLWSKVSGPDSSIVTTPNNPTTTVTNLKEGTYVFQLTVTDDKGATGTDEVSIIVKPMQFTISDPQPIRYSDGAYGKIPKDFDQFSKLKQVRGSAADSVSMLLIQITSVIPLRLSIPSVKDGTLSTLDNQYDRKSELPAIQPVNGKVIAIFNAPSKVGETTVQDAISRDIYVEVSLTDDISQKDIVPITLTQPPVVLVHDTWGDETDWQTSGFERNLNSYGFTLRKVSYSSVSALSLNPNSVSSLPAQYYITSAIFDAQSDLNNKGYASIKVDVIALGLGGLRVRGFIQNSLFYGNRVNKLITIGTPHLGTRFGPVFYEGRFAKVILDAKNIIDWIPGVELLPDVLEKLEIPISFIYDYLNVKRMGDAFDDIDPYYPANNSPMKNFERTNVKAYAIAGDYNPSGAKSFKTWDSLIWQSNLFLKAKNHYHYAAKDLNQEFNNEINDIFVTTNSAIAKFTDKNHFMIANSLVHGQGFNEIGNTNVLLSNANIQNKVAALLLSDNDNDFENNFPSPSNTYLKSNNLTNNHLKKTKSFTAKTDDLSDNSFISFDSVFLSKTYTNNSIVNVKVHLYNGAKTDEMYLFGENIGSALITNNVYQLKLPDNIPPGRFKLAVLGIRDSTRMYADTASIIVTNTNTIDSISVYPTEIKLDSAIRSSFINITGYYSKQDSTQSFSLNNYFNSHPVISSVFKLTENGEIDALQPGTDSIVININGVKNVVHISVDSNFLKRKLFETVIDFAPIDDVQFGSGPVTLVANASSGEKVNFSLVEGDSVVLINDVVYYKHPGVITIKASAPGNEYFDSTASIVRTFNVLKADQVITFDSIPNISNPDTSIILHAESSSSLLISYEVVSGPAVLKNDTLIITGTGTITVRAMQGGNKNYLAATPVDRTFIVMGTLAVSQLGFSGTFVQNNVLLNWQTVQETNTSYFIIERSSNAKDFYSIGKITAAGNSVTIKNYSYTDKQPLNNINYYRLKMIDVDGTFTYSKIISVAVNSSEKSFGIYPNPTNNTLYIKLSATNKEGTLQIINAAGRKVKEQTISLSGNTTSVNVKNLPNGVYDVIVLIGADKYHQKFIKE